MLLRLFSYGEVGMLYEKEYIQSRLYLAQPLNIACFLLIKHHIL